jgi:HK97 gp10 family phage protein
MLSGKVVRKITKNYPAMTKKVAGDFLPIAAKVVESSAKRNAPVDTGMLRLGIMSQVKGDKAIVSSLASYSTHVEYGTKKMKAQPFMRPALDKNRMKLIVLFRKMLGAAYDRR